MQGLLVTVNALAAVGNVSIAGTLVYLFQHQKTGHRRRVAPCDLVRYQLTAVQIRLNTEQTSEHHCACCQCGQIESDSTSDCICCQHWSADKVRLYYKALPLRSIQLINALKSLCGCFTHFCELCTHIIPFFMLLMLLKYMQILAASGTFLYISFFFSMGRRLYLLFCFFA